MKNLIALKHHNSRQFLFKMSVEKSCLFFCSRVTVEPFIRPTINIFINISWWSVILSRYATGPHKALIKKAALIINSVTVAFVNSCPNNPKKNSGNLSVFFIARLMPLILIPWVSTKIKVPYVYFELSECENLQASDVAIVPTGVKNSYFIGIPNN